MVFLKRLLGALFLIAWNFANSNIIKEHGNSRCLWVCCIHVAALKTIGAVTVLYNCVGFCVARSDDVGNAKASSCGMSDWYGLPRFLFYNNLSFQGVAGQTNTVIMKQTLKRMLSAVVLLVMLVFAGYAQEAAPAASSEVDKSSFSHYGIHYSADFESLDKGFYGISGHSFGKYVGVSLSLLNFNYGLVDSDYASYLSKIGPNYSYAFSKHVCFFVPLYLDLMWSSYPTMKHVEADTMFGHVSYDKKESKRKFHWGFELVPSFAFNAGKVVFTVGVSFNWIHKSDEIGTGGVVGIGLKI